MRRKSIGKNLVIVLAVIYLPLNVQDVKGDFVETDQRVNDPQYVSESLDKCISKGNYDDAKKIAKFATKKAGKYGVLILVEFRDELTLEKVQKMKQESPQRWKLFNSYLNKAVKWVKISLKAGKFTGGDLGKKIKKELGER